MSAGDDAAARQQMLFEAYVETRSEADLEALLDALEPLFRTLALRYRKWDAVPDLLQVARLGFWRKLDRFDPARGATISTYAWMVVSHVLQHHVRDRCWPLSGEGSDARSVALLIRARYPELARPPDDPAVVEMMARELGHSPDTVTAALRLLQLRQIASIDALPHVDASDKTSLMGVVDSESDQVDDKLWLEQLMSCLSGNERELVTLHFLEGLTKREIARATGVPSITVERRIDGALRGMRRAASEKEGDR